MGLLGVLSNAKGFNGSLTLIDVERLLICKKSLTIQDHKPPTRLRNPFNMLITLQKWSHASKVRVMFKFFGPQNICLRFGYVFICLGSKVSHKKLNSLNGVILYLIIIQYITS